jgi:hypothetical protein
MMMIMICLCLVTRNIFVVIRVFHRHELLHEQEQRQASLCRQEMAAEECRGRYAIALERQTYEIPYLHDIHSVDTCTRTHTHICICIYSIDRMRSWSRFTCMCVCLEISSRQSRCGNHIFVRRVSSCAIARVY